MSEQSKEADRKANTDAVETLSGDVKSTAASAVDAPDNQSSSGEDVQLDGSSEGAAADAGKHKKKSKRQKL